jgi:hypothetical protein
VDKGGRAVTVHESSLADAPARAPARHPSNVICVVRLVLVKRCTGAAGTYVFEWGRIDSAKIKTKEPR